MSDEPDSYEDLTACGLDDDAEQQLLEVQNECVFMWANSQGAPFGVVMSYLVRDGKIWLTCAERRKRVPAVRRDPRVSIAITSYGTALGSGKTITYKGTCTVRDDRETKDWFYPALAARLRPEDPDAAAVFEQFLDSPHRVILEVTPTDKLGFDSRKMWVRSPGAVPANRRHEIGGVA